MAASPESQTLETDFCGIVKIKKEPEIITQLSKILETYKKSRNLSILPGKYRSLKEFKDYKPVRDSTDTGQTFRNGVDVTGEPYVLSFGVFLNKVDVAVEILRTRLPDPRFDGDSYHIALRHGEHHAQKDKAMADILKHFLGYAADIDIIQDCEDFYVASRTIKNFKPGFDENTYILQPDGSVIEKSTGKKFQLKGLGAIAAIDCFFGSADDHSGNWGTQVQGNELVAYRIDSADSLDPECLEKPLTKEYITSFSYGLVFVREKIRPLKNYQDELMGMFKKIAATDFSIIISILERNIDAQPVDEKLWFLNWMLPMVIEGPVALSKKCRESLEECTKNVSELELSLPDFLKYVQELEKMQFAKTLELLEKRHEQLRAIFNISPKKSPMVVFSDIKGLSLAARKASDTDKSTEIPDEFVAPKSALAFPTSAAPESSKLGNPL